MSNGIFLTIIPEDLFMTVPLSGAPLPTTTLRLNNSGFKPIMFRLKTTAPSRYIVKPTKGVVKPNDLNVITIHMQEVVTEDVKDEFRLEFAVVEDGDVVGAKSENVAALLQAKSSQSGKFKRDIACRVSVERPALAVAAVKKPLVQPRTPLSPHVAPNNVPSSPVGETSTSSTTAAVKGGAVPLEGGAQPLVAAPVFGGALQATPEDAKSDSAKDTKTLETPVAPRPPVASTTATPPPPPPVTVTEASSSKLYLVIAVVAVVVAALWTQL